MTQWANLLIPAGSVIAGGLLTGGLTLWGQALVNKGTHAREREARHDAFKVRQREIERDALLELQGALIEHWNLRHEKEPGPRLDLEAKILAITARVPEDIVSPVSDYVRRRTVTDLADTDGIGEIARTFRDANLEIGRALRRDL